MKVKQTSPAEKLIRTVLRQECESAHARLMQAMNVTNHDRVEGVRGFRRCVKKIRCALRLTAGALGHEQRLVLDAQWAALARPLGAFRDKDALHEKSNQLILCLPMQNQEFVRAAWNQFITERAEVSAPEQHRNDVLEKISIDCERAITATETLRLAQLTPEMITGSVEHIWNRARNQTSKSWRGRDQVWLHALRKKVQRAHLALRLLRAQANEQGRALEKKLDDAAKSMGELRDADLVGLLLSDWANIQAKQSERPPTATALEMLQGELVVSQPVAFQQANTCFQRAFQGGISKILSHMNLSIHAA